VDAIEGILYEASEGVYRATATKPKAARAAKVLTPLETAPLVFEGAALEVALVAEDEPDEPDAPDVADGTEEVVNVTPTARQSCSAAESAAAKSLPVQVEAMQLAVLSTKAGVLHKHVSSFTAQPPRLAVSMHDAAQVGKL